MFPIAIFTPKILDRQRSYDFPDSQLRDFTILEITPETLPIAFGIAIAHESI